MSTGATIHRAWGVRRVDIANGAAISEEIDLRNAAGGMIFVPAEWTAADISFVAAEYRGDAQGTSDKKIAAPTFSKVRDKSGALVKITAIQTAEAGWYEIPSQVLQCGIVKLKSTNTASEADVNQGAARALKVALKT